MMKRFYRNKEIAVVEDDGMMIIMVPSTGKIHEFDEVSSFIWKQIPEEGLNVSSADIVLSGKLNDAPTVKLI